jgi:hypothetical protein
MILRANDFDRRYKHVCNLSVFNLEGNEIWGKFVL